MSKVATYLQEHILGEVTTNAAILDAMSRDGSVLTIEPEMVAYPRVTNDIRKIARFAWQLAEKGHVLPLTARGLGHDQTGGAIGKGIMLSFPAHMNRILEFDLKQKLIRLQPGLQADSLNEALLLHGVGIPMLADHTGTLGGAAANNASGFLSGRYGDISNWVSQLEVVLANGDVLQTERLSKREVSKRKGMQTFEGEIYRKLDNLIEDNKELIEKQVASNARDNAGYCSLANVKQKDGSLDLTPLFLGSQGTLGIISEMIMKCEFVSTHMAVAALAFTSENAARDGLDKLRQLEPAFLDYYDGSLFTLAEARGRKYEFMRGGEGTTSAVILVGFDEFSERTRTKKLKKIHKEFKNVVDCAVESADGEDATTLLAIREVTTFANLPDGKELSSPPLIDGAYIPSERFEEFTVALSALAEKYQIVLPLHYRVLEGLAFTRPQLRLHRVGDKQKIFKLLDEYSNVVEHFGGHLIGDNSEGRVKARFAHKQFDTEVIELFAAVKAIFDPNGILNPGVKQAMEVRQLVSHLRPGYDTANMASELPYN
jgi:FAD/FMN-containing dehydrogenase